MKKEIFLKSIFLTLLLGTTLCSGCSQKAEAVKTEEAALQENQGNAALQEAEAEEKLPPVEEKEATEEPQAEDLSGIENIERFYLQEHMLEKLAQNRFLVVGGGGSEFFDVYEQNRYMQIPNFITVDSIMHTYHLYFAMLQKNTEKNYLYTSLEELSSEMQRAAISQYETLLGTEWEEAARTNVAFFTIGASLMGIEPEIPDYVKSLVEEELTQVMNAEGIAVSTLNGEMEDYSQYKPRGYYDGEEKLEKYFRTMMWYGRRNFLQKEELTNRCALLMTLALQDTAIDQWEKVYTITAFFAGNSDDAGVYEYLPVIQRAYGEKVTVSDLIGNEKAFQTYRKLTEELAPPQINSVVFDDDGGQTDKTMEAKGFRFMGQRFSIDASIFTQLCYSKVEEAADGSRRSLPDSLDIPAALGSDTALKILEENGNYNFPGYEENMKKVREEIENASAQLWEESLYAGWLHTLKPILEEKDASYPAFMRSEEWRKKNLEGFLASYTELKHDSVLYSKQFVAEMGGGDDAYDDRGYVEPEVEVYDRLCTLTQKTSAGLEDFQIISDTDRDNLKKLGLLVERLKEISQKELSGEALSADDYELIRSYGGNLEHFWAETIKDSTEGEYTPSCEFPAALVVDVATDPNGSVLEQAIGGVSSIYVIVPVEGEKRIAHGAVFSYYQFEQALSDRLTDSQWRRMIGMELNDNMEYERDESISQPEWTQSYRSDWVYEAYYE